MNGKLQLLTIYAFLIGVSQQMTVKGTNPDFYDKADEFTDECLQIANANKEEIEKLYNDGKFGDSDEIKCFLRCILEKTDIMNSGGEIQESAFRASFPDNLDDDKLDEIVDTCMKAQTDDPCETAFKLAKCCEEQMN